MADLPEGSSDPLHVWFYGGVFGVGGSNGAISSWTTFNNVGENNARGVIRTLATSITFNNSFTATFSDR